MNRMLLFLLLVLLVGSGLAVIQTKYQSRFVFSQIQETEQALEQLEVQWKRLTLEEKTRSQHNEVEKKARRSMGLRDLDRKTMVYIQL